MSTVEADEGTRSAGAVGVVSDVSKDATRIGRLLRSRELELSAVVDVGDASDTGLLDALARMSRDRRVRVVLVIVGEPVSRDLAVRLAEVHRAVKPVVLLGGDDRQAVGVPPPAGPIRVTSLEEMADAAMLLVLQGLPPGRKVAVLTTEPPTLGTETDEELAQLSMLGPDLTQHTEMRIHFLSPGSTTRGAVLALPPRTTEGRVRDVVETLADDPGVDAVVLDRCASRALGSAPVMSGNPRQHHRRPPVIVAVDGLAPGHHRGSVPLFGTVHEALDSLARTCPRDDVRPTGSTAALRPS